MSQNLISLELSDEDVTAINAALTGIEVRPGASGMTPRIIAA